MFHPQGVSLSSNPHARLSNRRIRVHPCSPELEIHQRHLLHPNPFRPRHTPALGGCGRVPLLQGCGWVPADAFVVILQRPGEFWDSAFGLRAQFTQRGCSPSPDAVARRWATLPFSEGNGQKVALLQVQGYSSSKGKNRSIEAGLIWSKHPPGASSSERSAGSAAHG
jgi:hypothetical protein